MGYQAGTLDLSIFGVSDDAVKSINNVSKSLNSLSRAIQIIQKTDITKMFDKLAESVSIFSKNASKLDVSGFEKLSVIGTTGKGINSLANAINKLNASSTVFATQQISNIFEKLSVTSQKIDTTALSNLSSVGKSLSSISNISRLDKIDWDKAGQGFNKLETAITPFINKVKEAEVSLTALYGILSKSSGKKIGGLLDSGSATKSGRNLFGSFNRLFKIGSWTAVLYSARRLGGYMANVVTKGSDFGETINLWTVAMGKDFLPQATEFVNKLNEAYGISKKTLMNSQAIFKNMLGSLGEISSAQAYSLSEGITQMALDYASLYNVKFEDAMTKFQAALAGQVRPIRSVSGYDITENTLFQLYQQLGGTKTMRQLRRTEKQLLAIYAVSEQMERSGATGDLSRTLRMWANQTRVMKESWDDVQKYAGLTVKSLLEQWDVMKYINAVLIFMSRILEGLATSLDTGLGESGDVFGDMENSVTDTTEAVEGLQNALLDFDKFRALDQTNTVSDTLGIDETILNAMTQYDSILENANLEAREMADSWLKSLGFIDENNDGIIDISNGISDIVSLISNINWRDVGKKFSDVLHNAILNINDFLLEIDWVKVGNDISEFLLGIEWLTLLSDLWNTLGIVLGGLSEMIIGMLEPIFQELENAIYDLLEALGLKTRKEDEARKESIYSWFYNIGEGAREFFNDIVRWFKNRNASNATQMYFANGGLPDKGTAFIAGEAGAEMVYNMPSGQSGVANIRQIEQAMFNALQRHSESGGEPIVIQAYLDGEKVYENTTSKAKAHGKVWANA